MDILDFFTEHGFPSETAPVWKPREEHSCRREEKSSLSLVAHALNAS